MSYFRYSGKLKMRSIVGVTTITLGLTYAAADLNTRPFLEMDTWAVAENEASISRQELGISYKLSRFLSDKVEQLFNRKPNLGQIIRKAYDEINFPRCGIQDTDYKRDIG